MGVRSNQLNFACITALNIARWSLEFARSEKRNRKYVRPGVALARLVTRFSRWKPKTEYYPHNANAAAKMAVTANPATQKLRVFPSVFHRS